MNSLTYKIGWLINISQNTNICSLVKYAIVREKDDDDCVAALKLLVNVDKNLISKSLVAIPPRTLKCYESLVSLTNVNPVESSSEPPTENIPNNDDKSTMLSLYKKIRRHSSRGFDKDNRSIGTNYFEYTLRAKVMVELHSDTKVKLLSCVS